MAIDLSKLYSVKADPYRTANPYGVTANPYGVTASLRKRKPGNGNGGVPMWTGRMGNPFKRG